MKTTTLLTTDQFTLGITRYDSPHPPRGVAVISPATGMRQSYYRRFAEFLNAAGYTVITFDYRGIGASIPDGGIRAFSAHMRDWGQLDMPAVFEWVQAQFPDLPKHYVGHSFGGVGLGMSPQCQIFDDLVLISPPNFYYKNGNWRWRLGIGVLTQVYIPLSEQLRGYFVGKYVGLGDDLPRGIMREWANWVYHPNFLGATTQPLYFDHITAPLLAFSFTDDELAWNHRFFESMLAFYTQAEITHYHYDPSAFNLKKLGHNGFFRTHFPLWDEIVAWWAGQTAPPEN